MIKVTTTEAPSPAGHYSQAFAYNGFVFVSGQLPIDPETGKLIEGGIEAQVRQAIHNIKAILVASNSDVHLILKSTIYIPDISYWAEVNRVYAEVFGHHKPARTVVPSGPLHYGALLEMDVVAATIESDSF